MAQDNGQVFKKLDKSTRMQKIIDVSVGLFHKKGYRATTLDDVAKELGISKAALYHYVSSKENLLSTIYVQALENIYKNMNKFSARVLSPVEKLRLIIRNHIVEVIIKDLPLLSVFFSEENQLPLEENKRIRQVKNKYNQTVEDIIKEGIEQGIFRDVDPRLQANGIIGMCNWVYKWYDDNDTVYTPDQIADHFITLLESGYRKEVRDRPQANNPQNRDQIFQKIKDQCRSLADLIDQVE